MLSFDSVRENSKAFRAMTSLDVEEFLELLVIFEKEWHVYKNQQVQKNGTPLELTKGRKPVLQKEEDKLFFILFYFKSYPLQEIIAFLFGMSQGQANFWIHTLSGVLKTALEKNDFLPKRKRDDLKNCLTRKDLKT